MDLLSLGSLCVSCFLQVHSIYASRIKEVQVEQCVLEIECLTKQNFCWKDKPQDVLASMTLLLTLEVPQESEVRVDKHLQVHHMIMGVGKGWSCLYSI